MQQRETVASVAYDNVINELRLVVEEAMSLKSTIMDTEHAPRW